MEWLSFLFTINLAGLSLGAGAAFMVDVFFLLSIKDRKITHMEYFSINRLGIIVNAGFFLTLITEVLMYTAFPSDVFTEGDTLFISKLFILVVLFFTTLSFWKFHLPMLKRYQHDHLHLSDSFRHHSDGLTKTAAVSTVSWIFLIVLTSLSIRNPDLIKVQYNAVGIIASYIILAFISAKVLTHLRDRMLKRAR